MSERAHAETSITTRQRAHEVKREFVDFFKLILVFLLVFWLIKSFVIEGYEVQGDSMQPTLQDRDRILVFKLPQSLSKAPLFRWIQPFNESDIIVFEGAGRKRYVKRLIAFNDHDRHGRVDAQILDGGTPAVKVEFDRGVVRVNNWQIDESAYLPEGARQTRDRDVCLLHPGEHYVLGDNRRLSKDSRSFRAVTEDQIVGRALVRFWPLSKLKLL